MRACHHHDHDDSIESINYRNIFTSRAATLFVSTSGGLFVLVRRLLILPDLSKNISP